jgi:hypothetical protein
VANKSVHQSKPRLYAHTLHSDNIDKYAFIGIFWELCSNTVRVSEKGDEIFLGSQKITMKSDRFAPNPLPDADSFTFRSSVRILLMNSRIKGNNKNAYISLLRLSYAHSSRLKLTYILFILFTNSVEHFLADVYLYNSRLNYGATNP